MSGRFDHGELLHADSIHLDSAKRYTTLKGRTVYGGGGIMPDVFVPADTSERSAYLSELFFTGAINQAAFDLADSERTRLRGLGSPEAFATRYQVGGSELNMLMRTAERLGVRPDAQGMQRSRRLIAERLKAAIARNIWGDAGFYRIALGGDSLYNAARKALETGTTGLP
jgi:carboxyl-terminal processing protease